MNLNDLYEMRDPRDAYQRDVDNSTSGFGKNSQAYRADGGANDERHDLDQQPTWYIRLNGKLIRDKAGNPYSFQSKAAANKAALTMQAKLFNKDKEFMLTTNPNDKQQSVTESDDYSAVTGAITRRIITQHPEVLAKYGPAIVGQAIDEIADFVGNVDEIGSSDVSGWVSQVIRSLARFAPVRDEGVAESDDGRDKFYYQRNNIWRVMDGDELVHEYKPERYEVVGAKKLLARFDDEGYDVTHVISPMGFVTYLYGKPEDEDEVEEGFVGNMVNKAKSMFTKPGQPAAAPAPQAAAPVVPDAATQARIAAAPQGYDTNTGKPQVAAKAAPGVAKAATGAVKPKTSFGPTPKTPEQLRQIQQAKQATAKQATAPTAPAAAPAQQQPAAPRDTSKDQYDVTTGELTAYGKAEQEKKNAYYAKLKADAEAEKAQARKDFDARQALNNPAPVAQQPQQPAATPQSNVTFTPGADAVKAKLDAMKLKNPKLAAQMAQLGMDDEFNDALTTGQKPVAEAEVDSNGYSMDHADSGEYDYEGDQAKDQLNTIVRAARRLNGLLDDNENMPEWVQMKITNAADYIDTAADYIESNQEPELAEGDKIGNMDADAFDAAMARLKQLAGAGPMKTVYDPAKRVYRNVPTAVQPKK